MDAIKEAKPGDTVLVSPGTYHESLWLEKWPSGEPGNPITLRAEKGAILDGYGVEKVGDVWAGINIKDAHDIIVEGFLVQRFDYRIFIDRCERMVLQKNVMDCKADPKWANSYGIRVKSCKDLLFQFNVVKSPRRGEYFTSNYPVSIDGGNRNIIRYNWVLDGACYDIMTTRHNSDTDIYENVIRGQTSDDGVELEGGTCINLRFFNNLLDCHDGRKGTVSTTPVNVGPIYVVRNVFLCSIQVNKYFNDGTSGAVHAGHRMCDFGNTFFYHNVFFDPKGGFFRGTCAHGRPVFVNNITWGKAIPDISQALKAPRTSAGYFQPAADYNLYWDMGKTTKSPTPGLDEHSLFADPLFADAGKDDFTVKEGSPALDKAMRLPNINDHFAGAGPDIGCFERGSDWSGRTLKEPLKEDPR